MQAGGFTPVSIYFLDHYGALPSPIKASEAMLVIHLIRHKFDSRAPFPALGSLAKKMGVTEAAVRNRVKSLEKKGYIKRRLRHSKSTEYDLTGLFAALESLIASQKQSKETADSPF